MVPNGSLLEGKISYITTGAMVPEGANAVVKVEDTVKLTDNQNAVQINIPAQCGDHIREIGSDIRKGEVVLDVGQIVGPAEIGLLATIGYSTVECFKKPIIGVLSTGSELINPWFQKLSFMTVLRLSGCQWSIGNVRQEVK